MAPNAKLHPVRKRAASQVPNLYISRTRQTGISPRIDMRWRDFPRGLPSFARRGAEECFRIVGRFPLRIWLGSHTLFPHRCPGVRDRVCSNCNRVMTVTLRIIKSCLRTPEEELGIEIEKSKVAVWLSQRLSSRTGVRVRVCLQPPSASVPRDSKRGP